jgi:hypothetical protein
MLYKRRINCTNRSPLLRPQPLLGRTTWIIQQTCTTSQAQGSHHCTNAVISCSDLRRFQIELRFHLCISHRRLEMGAHSCVHHHLKMEYIKNQVGPLSLLRSSVQYPFSHLSSTTAKAQSPVSTQVFQNLEEFLSSILLSIYH